MTAWAPPLTTTVISLYARRARGVVPGLVAALLLGLPVAAFSVAAVAGIGAEAIGARGAALLLPFALIAVVPAAVLTHRWIGLRRPSTLVIDAEAITIVYPQLLRRPLVVPRAALRVAAVDAQGDARFRVHSTSGPYGGGEDDEFLWGGGGWSPLPVLATGRAHPNVLLVFDPPVAGADVHRSRLGAVYRGERLAGVLLAVRDPARAERALSALGVCRPLTMPDAISIEEHLNAPAADGGRRGLERRQAVRIAWGSIAVGIIAPPIAILGVLIGTFIAFDGDRTHGAAMAVAGLTVFGVRLALYV